MDILLSDLGVRIGNNNHLSSIGRTSVLLEWAEDGTILYRMLLDMGLKSDYIKDDRNRKRILDLTNISRIENIMQDKVLGFDNGIQCMALSHCHQDHAGGYPWFFQMCKNKKIRPPSLYMTRMTRSQFIPFQNELYDLFEEPAKGTVYDWDKSIINEIVGRDMTISKDYNTPIIIEPRPPDFDIKLTFKNAGHIVGSTMTELETVKYGDSIGEILFTGDICFRDGSFLVDHANMGDIKKHYKAIIFEGTYMHHGFFEYKKEYEKYAKLKRNDLKRLLKKYVEDTLGKGGNLILLVYAMDRSANILSALRELIDAEEGVGIDIDLKNRIFLDTSSGRIITNEYLDAFQKFIMWSGEEEEKEGYLRRGLKNRCNQGFISFLQSADKRYIFEPIRGSEDRLETIERFGDGGCIIIATSATLDGGTALLQNSYMYPNGWGDNLKNLFLIIGKAIPGTTAWYAVNDIKENGCAWLPFLAYGDDGKSYINWGQFCGRLEEFDQFSAHANYTELVGLINGTDAEKYLLTHIGGGYGIDRMRRHINDTFMSGIKPFYRQGVSLEKRKNIEILTATNKIHIRLDPSKDSLPLDGNTKDMLRGKCIRLKGSYNDVVANDVIRYLISEHDKIIKEKIDGNKGG
jgi:predicted metal-dependent RNase